MDVEVGKLFSMAISMGMGSLGPAIAIGILTAAGLNAVGRNPETADKIRTLMILGIAFAEAIAIYALVVALLIKFA